MASNMWKNVEEHCDICDERIGVEIPGEYEEDGVSPRYLSGCTIESEEGYYLTVCQDCLRLIVNRHWERLDETERFGDTQRDKRQGGF